MIVLIILVPIAIVCTIIGVAACILSSRISQFEETPEYQEARARYLKSLRGEG